MLLIRYSTLKRAFLCSSCWALAPVLNEFIVSTAFGDVDYSSNVGFSTPLRNLWARGGLPAIRNEIDKARLVKRTGAIFPATLRGTLASLGEVFGECEIRTVFRVEPNLS
jgi:hypothetical protein